MIPLSDEQKQVFHGVLKEVKKKKEIRIGGIAGTGKSLIVAHLHKSLPDFGICAFTGKAASVLKKRGIYNASTIHSLIYVPEPEDNGMVTFYLRDKVDVDGFIVDEASMINHEIYQDLQHFGLPIIFVGDHGQLEPIGSNPNLMKSVDYKLETVHRNAGEICHFANWIRQNKVPEEFPREKQVEFVPAYHRKAIEDSEEILTNVDQIICAYNVTRQSLNRKVREFNKFKDMVEVGDRVMCLKNNKKLGLFNGIQGHVVKKHKGNVFDIDTELGLYTKIDYHPATFNMEKIPQDFDFEGTNPFTYAYAATCHKMQGSSAADVLVFEQICNKWDHVRWAYTAASRAEEKLIWVGAYRKGNKL